MTGDNEDRPKKSWREIDKQRDGSVHRKEDRPAPDPSRRPRSAEYRSYKSQLNRLFDGGALPEALQEKLDDSMMDEVKKRKAGLDAVKTAASPKQVRAALTAFRQSFGFPEDEEVLARLLDLQDEDVVLETILTLDRLREEGRLKRAGSLKGRLKTVQMTMDEPDIQNAARALVKKL
jgi:hypothetical protein